MALKQIRKKKTTPTKGIPPKYMVAIVAMVVIGTLEIFALSNGIDGTIFTAAMAAIGGIAGYALRGKGDSL